MTTPISSLFNPTPCQLRSLVLDYLCNSCYTRTAIAFARDSTIRQLDADGDEIIEAVDPEDPSSSTEQFENQMKEVALRQEIRTQILSGRVDDAIILLRKHFPSVLRENNPGSASTVDSRPSSSNNIEYVSSTSTEPAHLILNLRILAFSEACRTVPLEYPPSKHSALTNSISTTTSTNPEQSPAADMEDNPDSQQMALLTTAQKLYALSNTLPNPVDRATYLKELENVGGLLAYKVPEKSSMAKYLTLERREAVADQINRAILNTTGRPLVSSLELLTRHTDVLWQYAHQHGAKSRPGAVLPRKSSKAATLIDSENEVVPPFDLHQFLNVKP